MCVMYKVSAGYVQSTCVQSQSMGHCVCALRLCNRSPLLSCVCTTEPCYSVLQFMSCAVSISLSPPLQESRGDGDKGTRTVYSLHWSLWMGEPVCHGKLA